MILAGGRRTGKTYFTKTLLERNRDFISVPLDTIVWFYGVSQEQVFSELAETVQGYGQRIEFVCGLPQDSTVKDFIMNIPGQQKLIVLDDLMEKASNLGHVAELSTQGRHDNVSIIFLTQNFFHSSK